MEKNIFKLDNEQLKAIARSFKEKVEKHTIGELLPMVFIGESL
jgi:cytidine deaminase